MSTQDIRGTSSVNSGALNRRDVLLASTSVVVASALGSTALMPITQAQAQGAQSGAETPITEQEAHAIGVNAYLYFYSLVTMDISRRVATNVEAGKIPGFGPPNRFHSFAAYPTADFKSVVRANFDTLYSSAFLDMTKEPMIVSAPDTGGRYYLLPMLDKETKKKQRVSPHERCRCRRQRHSLERMRVLRQLASRNSCETSFPEHAMSVRGHRPAHA
jgi:hypothetical protein